MTEQRKQEIIDAADRFTRQLDQLRRLAAAMQRMQREIAA